jgi:hypothetical protein
MSSAQLKYNLIPITHDPALNTHIFHPLLKEPVICRITIFFPEKSLVIMTRDYPFR